MPSIDVTMGDGATVDATMAGEAIAVEVNGAGYTDRQAVDALDGETVTPGQVGTADDRTTAYHDSTHSQELSVGATGPVTGIVGDSGEYEVFESHFRKKNTSTTSQEWSYYIYELNTPRIVGEKNKKTGINGYYAAFAANMGREDGDDTATTSMRFSGAPSSETTITGTTTANNDVVSPLVPISDVGISLDSPVESFPLVEAKTDTGTAALRSVTFYLVGEIA